MSLPHCPQCNSEYTYEDNGMFICPECAHEWNDAEPTQDSDALVVKDANGNLADYEVKPYPSFPDKEYATKAVRMERRLELALEGHRYFDLVRWGFTAGKTGGDLQKL